MNRSKVRGLCDLGLATSPLRQACLPAQPLAPPRSAQGGGWGPGRWGQQVCRRPEPGTSIPLRSEQTSSSCPEPRRAGHPASEPDFERRACEPRRHGRCARGREPSGVPCTPHQPVPAMAEGLTARGCPPHDPPQSLSAGQPGAKCVPWDPKLMGKKLPAHRSLGTASLLPLGWSCLRGAAMSCGKDLPSFPNSCHQGGSPHNTSEHPGDAWGNACLQDGWPYPTFPDLPASPSVLTIKRDFAS